MSVHTHTLEAVRFMLLVSPPILCMLTCLDYLSLVRVTMEDTCNIIRVVIQIYFSMSARSSTASFELIAGSPK